MNAPPLTGVTCCLLLVLAVGAAAGLLVGDPAVPATVPSAIAAAAAAEVPASVQSRTAPVDLPSDFPSDLLKEPPAKKDGGEVSSEVLEKRFVFGSPAANTYTVSTDTSFIITFVFNLVFLGLVTLAVANAAQQAGVAAAASTSRRRLRVDTSPPLERRVSSARHRRRPFAAAATLPPATVNAIVEHVSAPSVINSATAAAADVPPATLAASDSYSVNSGGDYGGHGDHVNREDYGGDYGSENYGSTGEFGSDYERYPSRYEEPTTPPEKKFRPTSVADILDYLYETDRTLYDELQLRVALRSRTPSPPVRGADDRQYAEYLASVYGYKGLKWDRDGRGDTQQEDGRGEDDWKADQQSAQLSYLTGSAQELGGGSVVKEKKRDPLGAPLKYRQR